MPIADLIRRTARSLAVLAAGILFLPIILMPTGGACDDRVLIFAAASTREAVEAVVAIARRESGLHAVSSFAGSSSLARQIEAGAPADLFLSANVAWMDHLEQRGAVAAGTRRDLVRNRLVLIGPAADPPSVDLPDPLNAAADLAAALADGRLAIAEPTAVPAGIYGRQALSRLGLWPAVADRLAPTADVRAALALVARGETPLGLVYATDALAAAGVVVVSRLPADSHDPIVYPVALTQSGAGRPAARALYDLLTGPRGLEEFRARGFEPAQP